MDTEIMEATHEPLRRTAALTIHGDGLSECGWMELYRPSTYVTDREYELIKRGVISIYAIPIRHSKQTRAFLRVQRREKPAIHAHKRPTSPRRMAVYQRRKDAHMIHADSMLSDYRFSTPTWQQSYYGGWIHL